MPMLAIVVGLAMIVGAIGIVSNKLTLPNTVTAQPITLTQESINTVGMPASGLEHPNWASGIVVVGITYDMGIRLASTASLPAVIVSFEIHKTVSLDGTDVSVKYYDGVVWQVLSMTKTDDHLAGTYGPAGGFPVVAGYNVLTPLLVTYNVAGAFTTDVQALAL